MSDSANFEENMKQLEQIAKELETGDLDLDASVKKFEEGMKISKECEEKLTNIEAKLAKILQDNQLEDLNLEDNESSNG